MSHTGKAIIELSRDKQRVFVLCSHRHLYTTMLMTEWAGSREEARLGTPPTITCDGTLPTGGQER